MPAGIALMTEEVGCGGEEKRRGVSSGGQGQELRLMK